MNIDAHKFDQIARNAFAPVYPLLAEQAMAKSGISAGIFLTFVICIIIQR